MKTFAALLLPVAVLVLPELPVPVLGQGRRQRESERRNSEHGFDRRTHEMILGKVARAGSKTSGASEPCIVRGGS